MRTGRQRGWHVGNSLAILIILAAWANGQDQETRPPWTTSRIAGTPQPPSPYALRPAFPNLKFSRPTSLQELPGGRILITEIGGELFTFSKQDRQTSQKDPLLHIQDASVWHATVHPKFATNHRLFVCYSKKGTTYVSRLQVAGSPPRADPKSEEVLLTWPAGGHNGGCLQFGTDGMLYISTGDGSGPNPPDGRTAAQDVSNLFGCILRIDVDRHDPGKPYAVPADNPFVKHPGARAEIWAYGLRNPWKFGIDRKSGAMFAADNGWETWEMVHRIVRGGNCGWPIMEGRAILRSEVQRGPTAIRPPVKDHSHTEANSVIGGPVYRGSKLKDLHGTFVYGDYITGTIWGLHADGPDSYTHRTLVDTDQRITAFAEGSSGELWVLDYDYTGQIYELVPSRVPDRSAEFPRRLSETGLFTSLKEMKPAPGVVPYDVVAPRWMDGALTRRWVAIPGNGSVQFGETDSSAVYPEGTVFVKHVVLPRRGPGGADLPVETQLLHYERGTWHPYSYAWDAVDDKSAIDAILVEASGADRPLPDATDGAPTANGTNWHFSAENECRLCHNAGSGSVLGFVANQLDRAIVRPPAGHVPHQLKQLAREQTIDRMPELPEDRPGRLVDPHDSAQTLDDRARSYLHANCSSCHHPGGNAIVSFYLRREMPFDTLKTNKGTGIGTFGMKNAKLIVPGDPYRSVLFYRMMKLGYGRMPYIGSRQVDSKGVALIDAWIRSLPRSGDAEESPPLQARSPESQALARLKQAHQQSQPAPPEAVRSLLQSTEGALALLSALHAQTVPPIDLIEAYESTPSDIRGLMETFVPEPSRRKTLGRTPDPKSILSLEGDSARGQLIFSSDAARCRNCHQAENAALSTGPTLAEIRKKYKRREELLQHILQPSLKVEDKFVSRIVLTDSGKVFTGLLIRENNREIVLKTAEQKTVRIPKAEIEAIRKSPRSLMPEGILSDLTAQEAADLLQWFGELP